LSASLHPVCWKRNCLADLSVFHDSNVTRNQIDSLNNYTFSWIWCFLPQMAGQKRINTWKTKCMFPLERVAILLWYRWRCYDVTTHFQSFDRELGLFTDKMVDIFKDEQTFYFYAFTFTLATVVAAFILSRFITLNPSYHSWKVIYLAVKV